MVASCVLFRASSAVESSGSPVFLPLFVRCDLLGGMMDDERSGDDEEMYEGPKPKGKTQKTKQSRCLSEKEKQQN